MIDPIVNKSTFSLANTEGSASLAQNSILFDTSSVSKQSVKQETEQDDLDLEDNDKKYVVILAVGRDEDNRIVKRWKEFAWPLEEERVEAWCKLTNVYFHPVVTFDMCVQYDTDFVSYAHQVDDSKKLKAKDLEHEKCYLVVGHLDLLMLSCGGYGG
jgi:hypothetical protein